MLSTAQQPPAQLIESLGLVVELMAADPALAARGSAYLAQCIWPALLEQRLQLYFNADGHAVACVVWAWMSARAEDALLDDPAIPLAKIVSDGGDALWLTELIVRPGHLKHVLAELRDSLFSRSEAVRYVREKQGMRVAREIARNSRHGFFRPAAARHWRCGQPHCQFCRTA